MTGFSLGTIWEEMIAFLRRERGLLVPVALAIFGPAQVLLGLGMQSTAPAAAGAAPQVSGQTLLALPAIPLVIFGHLVISTIVLVPGISVQEALMAALRRLATALGAMALIIVAAILIGVAIIVAATLGTMTFQADPRSPAVANQLVALMLVPMLILAIRLLLLMPIIAAEHLTPAESIKRAWAVSRKNFLRFTGVWALAMFLGVLLAMVEKYVIGSIIQLLQLALSDAELLALVELLINAALDSLLAVAMAVFVALIYRKVAAPSV